MTSLLCMDVDREWTVPPEAHFVGLPYEALRNKVKPLVLEEEKKVMS
jgi:hypothetical protein